MVLKSHHARQIYGSDMNVYHYSLCIKLNGLCDLDFQANSTVSGMRHNSLVMMIICGKKSWIPPCRRMLWSEHKCLPPELCTKSYSVWSWPSHWQHRSFMWHMADDDDQLSQKNLKSHHARQLWVGHYSGSIQTNKHTYSVNTMPFCHFMVGA